FHPQIPDVHVRDGIDQTDRALGRVRIETILEERRAPSRNDRRAREAMVPRDRRSVPIETGGESVEESRPVHVVLDIFLARPDHLHRTLYLHGDLDGSGDAVDLEPASKA